MSWDGEAAGGLHRSAASKNARSRGPLKHWFEFHHRRRPKGPGRHGLLGQNLPASAPLPWFVAGFRSLLGELEYLPSKAAIFAGVHTTAEPPATERSR